MQAWWEAIPGNVSRRGLVQAGPDSRRFKVFIRKSLRVFWAKISERPSVFPNFVLASYLGVIGSRSSCHADLWPAVPSDGQPRIFGSPLHRAGRATVETRSIQAVFWEQVQGGIFSAPERVSDRKPRPRFAVRSAAEETAIRCS